MEISKLSIDGTLYDMNKGKQKLSELNDTEVVSPSNGQALVFDEEAMKWVNQDIATPTDEQVGNAVENWLDEHPEATTTVEDGSISEAKLTSPVLKKINRLSNIVYAGKVFEKPEGLPYCGWPFNNIQYDSELNCIVFLINAAVKHGENDTTHLYMGKLNLYTYEVGISEIGNPETLEHGFYTMGFCINDEGEYLYVDAESKTLGRSSDKGATWTETDISAYNSWPEGIKQLSNGRYLFWGDGSTKGVWYSDDDCATWTKATMSNAKYEGSFLELTGGKVICFMRKSTNGTTDGTWNGTKRQEAVVLSFSNDYGATWTSAADSATLLEGCANIATAFYHKNEGLIEVFTSPRFPYGDTKGAIWQYIATVEDALNDEFGTPKLVTYAKAAVYQDFGHIGGCFDGKGSLHLMYYDGDASESGSVNYYYMKGSREQVDLPIHAENGSSMYLPYSADQTDKIIRKNSKLLQEQINGLIFQGGGSVSSPDYYVTDQLKFDFNFELISRVNRTNGTITDSFGSSMTGTFNAQNIATGDLKLDSSVISAKMTDKSMFSVEMIFNVTNHQSGDSNVLKIPNVYAGLRTKALMGKWTNTSDADQSQTDYYKDYDNPPALPAQNNSIFFEPGLTQIVIVYGSDGKIYLYRNKVLIHTITCSDWKSFATLLDDHFYLVMVQSYAKWLAFRVYNKALSLAEIEQNYNYMMY